MTTIFRLDSSIRTDGSVTRAVSDTLVTSIIEAEGSDTTVTHRDVATDPIAPDVWSTAAFAGFVPQEQRGLWTIGVVLAITGWAASSRVLRAQTMSIRNRDYVNAARVSGERSFRVIAVEILPNLLPVLASQFVFAVIAAILAEAGLAFLGLGASNSSTLGTMLFYAQNGFALPLGAWWWFGPPGLIIALFGTGLSLINFSIDEIINPKLKNVRLHRKRARLAKKASR